MFRRANCKPHSTADSTAKPQDASLRLCLRNLVGPPAYVMSRAGCRHIDDYLPCSGSIAFRSTYSAISCPTASLMATVLG